MPFFDPPEPESSPFGFDEDYSQPDWFGPPSNVLGMPVAERVILVQRSDLLIAVTGFIAYATGLQFETVIRGTDRRVGRAMHGTFRSPYDDQPDEAYRDSVFRFGVLTADGTDANTRGGSRVLGCAGFDDADESAQPPAPVLVENGGGGSSHDWRTDYWLWPLPPEGPFEFVCEWPVLDVPETHSPVDPGPFRAAAERAVVLWEGGSTSHQSASTARLRMVVKKPDQPDEVDPA